MGTKLTLLRVSELQSFSGKAASQMAVADGAEADDEDDEDDAADAAGAADEADEAEGCGVMSLLGAGMRQFTCISRSCE